MQISKRTSSSSGFSSARSERSDSSLSLTETNIPVPPPASSKPKKVDTANCAKSSKILSSKSKDEPKRKDRSPHRSQELEQPTKLQKIPQNAKMQQQQVLCSQQIQQMQQMQYDSKLKQSMVGRKVDVVKADMKTSCTSLLQQPKSMSAPQAVGTGIPKPVAAIKGTTKPVVIEQQGKGDTLKSDKSGQGLQSEFLF